MAFRETDVREQLKTAKVADALVSLSVVGTGAVYWWTSWDWLDPVASLAIAAIIVVSS